jgi:alanine dehydrogenase
VESGSRLRLLDSGALPLYLTEAHIEKLLTPADALAAIEPCFERQARGVIRNRPRQRTRAGEGALAVMSAVDEELGLAGLKSYAALPAGTRFMVVLFDLAKGEVAAVIEADKMGQLRTGAASAVAAKHLARDDARTLGVIGCGWQAESQVACIREALPGIEQVVAYCRTEKSLLGFCDKTGAEPGESHRDAAGCDVVVTITSSRDPVLRGEWLAPGAHVTSLGSDQADKQELTPDVMGTADLVVADSVAQCLRIGELHHAVEAGAVDPASVVELGAITGGAASGRGSDAQRTVCDLTGVGVQDVAAAALVLAGAGGAGDMVPL